MARGEADIRGGDPAEFDAAVPTPHRGAGATFTPMRSGDRRDGISPHWKCSGIAKACQKRRAAPNTVSMQAMDEIQPREMPVDT